jgi:uncharacterized membrane protein YeaQ/YmgE (transglycosylase-associated protein family)
MEIAGAIAFGLVIGWVTYRTLRRNKEGAGISDIAAVIGAVGGGVVTALFEGEQFAAYAIGLAIGFFGYFIVGLIVDDEDSPGGGWMMDG